MTEVERLEPVDMTTFRNLSFNSLFNIAQLIRNTKRGRKFKNALSTALAGGKGKDKNMETKTIDKDQGEEDQDEDQGEEEEQGPQKRRSARLKALINKVEWLGNWKEEEEERDVKYTYDIDNKHSSIGQSQSAIA